MLFLRLSLFAILFLLILPGLTRAETSLLAIPQPSPRLVESTIIQGTGWSAPGNRNESLACELAGTRALTQLKHGITVAQDKRLVSPEEFGQADPLQISRLWNQDTGVCTIQMQLIVPVIKQRSVPILHKRQF